MWMRDELGQIYADEDVADLYDNRGQPGWSAWRLALIDCLKLPHSPLDDDLLSF
jgi:hypothetical protein